MDEAGTRRPPSGVVATALAGLLLAVGLIGLLGRWSGWADLVNQFTPVWLTLAAGALMACLATRARPAHRRLAPLLIAATAIQAAFMAPEVARALKLAAFDHRPATDHDFTVLTFNIWNASPDIGLAARTIAASGADVVTVQEALALRHAAAAPIATRVIAAAYPYRATCDDWWGCEIMILSRRPILQHGFTAPRPTGPGGPLWAVWIVTTAPDGRPVTVVSTHLARPIPPGLRDRQVRQLAELTRAFQADGLIVTGDCNASGPSFAMRRQDALLAPLTRRTQEVFTWPAMVDVTAWPAPFPILAIDQVYAGAAWRTQAVQRLPRSGSDHYPVLVRLERDDDGAPTDDRRFALTAPRKLSQGK
jgi:endonuclease/exonuclease/phosphatase (EEP) superfamily protein YafD